MKKIELQPLSERCKADIVRSVLSPSFNNRIVTLTSETMPRDINAMLNHAFKVAKETIK